jgi:NAD(P)-dependent dehydrogenase (short-subunit alcohol dehydrogenase family)
MILEKKVAIVTGATSGIGRAVAEAFAREGAITYIVGIQDREGEELEKQLKSEGYSAVFLNADVSSSQDTDRVVGRVLNEQKRVDILVNNAGMAYKATVATLTEEQWDRQLAVNLKSVYLYCHRIIPVMEKQGGGAIINMGSVTSLVGVPDFAAYVASKAGMLGLTRAMALDHADRGIRVNIVCPSGVRTALMDWQFSVAPDPQAEIKRVLELHPIGRMAGPEEIADFVVYLASEKARYLTGAAFSFDGGYTAR